MGVETTADELGTLTPADARVLLVNALDAKHRPEMREMEKVVLLQILDSSWMEHLRAMDHLRSSIGLQGYAQIDPKVEYKREGMRIFAEMWNGIGDRVTDLIFRVEQFDPEFLSYLGSHWQLDRAQTIHQQAESQLAAAAAGLRRHPPGSKTPPSPPASSPPRRNASPSATLEKRSAATTPAPADPVKNSKPAACANNPRTILFNQIACVLVFHPPDHAGRIVTRRSLAQSSGEAPVSQRDLQTFQSVKSEPQIQERGLHEGRGLLPMAGTVNRQPAPRSPSLWPAAIEARLLLEMESC